MCSDKKNVFVSSYNQQGGITAGVVNLGHQARQLTPDLVKQLEQKLSHDKKIKVFSVLGDSESFGFANQIIECLRQKGYKNVDGVNQGIYIKPIKGQHINYVSDNEIEITIGAREE